MTVREYRRGLKGRTPVFLAWFSRKRHRHLRRWRLNDDLIAAMEDAIASLR